MDCIDDLMLLNLQTAAPRLRDRRTGRGGGKIDCEQQAEVSERPTPALGCQAGSWILIFVVDRRTVYLPFMRVIIAARARRVARLTSASAPHLIS